MTDTKQSPTTGGSTPWGRIAGVAVLAGGVIAFTVVAINSEQAPRNLGESETREVSNQSVEAEVETAASRKVGESELAQADLSAGEISPELTARLIDSNPDPDDFAAAMEELKQIQEARRARGTAAPGRVDQGDTAVADRQRQKDALQAAADARKPSPQPVAGANPNAGIAFESLVYDFGDIYSTTEIPGRFTFTSTGSEELVIEQVRPACGCTSSNATELRNSRWAPGEGSAIEFSYRPSQQPGLQKKTISVVTNSEQNRTIVLELQANYIPAVKTSAQTANFGRIESGSIGQARIVVESRDPDFRFEDFDLGESAEHFNWNYSELESTDPNYPSRGQLLIQTKPDTRTGPISRIIGIMKVMTREGDSAEQKPQTFNIAMRGEVVGQIEIEPAFARSPLAAPGTPFEHRVVVKSRKNQPFQITEVKLVDGEATDFSYEIVPVADQNGLAHELVIRGTAPQRAGGYMGKVDIYTDIANHGPTPFQFSGVLRAAPINQ